MNPAGPRIVRHTGWALALVPLLLLRALIPAGFMPAVGAGSLALVYCEPGALVAPSSHAHHAPGAEHAGHGAHTAAGECPFAQSAAPALPTLLAAVLVQPQPAPVAAAPRDDQHPAAVPLRHAAARGPPRFC